MKCCAVVDTNVLVAALLSKRDDSATVRVIRAMISGEFIPLYHEDILAEYEDVLHRKKKYDLSESAIQTVLNAIRRFGIEVFPKPTGEIFIDEDDIIFYEVAMEKREDNAYLVTGNMKHYPVRDFIVTPAEMVAILEEKKVQERKEKE
jgi:putative PIN family toxin of toxin-antitoxin system